MAKNTQSKKVTRNAAGRKAIRSDAKKTLRNRKIRGVYRSNIKELKLAVRNGEIEKLVEIFKRTQKSLDKAVQKKVLKKNTASRYKSRLNTLVKNAK